MVPDKVIGVEGIWKGSTFVLGRLGTGPHKFPGLDDAMLAPKGALSLSPSKTVLRAEEPHSTRGDPVDAEPVSYTHLDVYKRQENTFVKI